MELWGASSWAWSLLRTSPQTLISALPISVTECCLKHSPGSSRSLREAQIMNCTAADARQDSGQENRARCQVLKAHRNEATPLLLTKWCDGASSCWYLLCYCFSCRKTGQSSDLLPYILVAGVGDFQATGCSGMRGASQLLLLVNL